VQPIQKYGLSYLPPSPKIFNDVSHRLKSIPKPIRQSHAELFLNCAVCFHHLKAIVTGNKLLQKRVKSDFVLRNTEFVAE